MPDIVVLIFVCVLTYSFEIVFGLAGTILMLALLSSMFDPKILVIYSVLPQILVGGIGLLRSPPTVNVKFLLGMFAFAALGTIAGLSLFYWFPATVFQRLLASVITLFGVYLVMVPRLRRLSPTGAQAWRSDIWCSLPMHPNGLAFDLWG